MCTNEHITTNKSYKRYKTYLIHKEHTRRTSKHTRLIRPMPSRFGKRTKETYTRYDTNKHFDPDVQRCMTIFQLAYRKIKELGKKTSLNHFFHTLLPNFCSRKIQISLHFHQRTLKLTTPSSRTPLLFTKKNLDLAILTKSTKTYDFNSF